jgi:hypothetical protein
MERRVSVNVAAVPTVTPDGLPQGWSHSPGPASEARDEQTEAPPIRGTRANANVDQGPCLYLGPSGQRCGRRAVAGGFCQTHRPDRPQSAATNPGRFWAAAAAIIGLLWPYLEFVVREIIRWAHSH